jgi:dUTP pyrophosphatase
MKINVYKIRENAILPSRSHPTDAGMDLFFCPTEQNMMLTIPPGASAVLQTGLKIEVPEGHMIQIMNRSGVASKRQLITGACVVDCGYDGEVFINLQNIGKETQFIESGSKIAQAVCIPVAIPELVQIKEDNIYGSTTARGSGGFGSSGDS